MKSLPILIFIAAFIFVTCEGSDLGEAKVFPVGLANPFVTRVDGDSKYVCNCCRGPCVNGHVQGCSSGCSCTGSGDYCCVS